MPTGTIRQTITIAGIQISGTTIRTEVGQISHELALVAGQAGELTTRTNATDGEITTPVAHGIGAGDQLWIFWDDGKRYNVDIESVTADTITFDNVPGSGAGSDDLPLAGTDVVVCVPQRVDTDFDGDLMEMFAIHSTVKGHADCRDAADAELAEFDLPANEAYDWANGRGVTVPITGNPVGYFDVANGSVTAGTLKIGVLYDSA